MKRPEKFNRVVVVAMITIAITFITIGTLGYLALGDKVETIVFLNLPKSPVVSAIQFMYAIAIMLSFPLCIYPAIRITEQGLLCSCRHFWLVDREIFSCSQMAKELLPNSSGIYFGSGCLGWFDQFGQSGIVGWLFRVYSALLHLPSVVPHAHYSVKMD
jgi:amino acid permease